MILTLDNELACLVTDLKWADWTAQYILAIHRDETAGTIFCAHVVTDAEAKTVQLAPQVRLDYWSIGDLFMDLLCSVAYGFPMSHPTDSHRYVFMLLHAIRTYEAHPEHTGWTGFPVDITLT